MRSLWLLAFLLPTHGMIAQEAPPELKAITSALRARNLEADVSFLASDTLQGRATPSPGLDAAAEFIASQFRRAALDPLGDNGYLQTGRFHAVRPNTEGLELSLGATKADPTSIAIQEPAAADLNQLEAYKFSATNRAALEKLSAGEVKGKVIFLDLSDGHGALAAPDAQQYAMKTLSGIQPALIVTVRPAAPPANLNARVNLREQQAAEARMPVLTTWDPALRAALDAAADGPLPHTASARVAAPHAEPAVARNVVAMLRGADPALQDTYILVSAHYDHLGIRGSAEDRIFNGANDDASGTASVIEIAAALASLPEKPKRSIVFAAFFGEESGGHGARYFINHPPVPLAKIAADINLEQLGRVDDSEGERRLEFNLTGFDYTNLEPVISAAAAQAGVRTAKHPVNSDLFFSRSDNIAFARVGIPSTTISVAYVFPDYHKASDEWNKLDYANMAKVDQAIALAVWDLANSSKLPSWNTANPKTEPYVSARQKLTQ